MTLPIASARRAAGLVLLGLALSCGGDGGTPPPEAETLTAVGSTTLQGFTDEDVTLQVRVLGTDGQPFAGTQVTWAVTGGGGGLGGTSSTTGEDGIAEVVWTLGPAAGVNSATASAAGLGTVNFEATATFRTLEPEVDVPVEGDLTVERMIVPQGVTVTVTGPTTITVDGEVDIDGTVAGDCVALAVTGSSTGSFSGEIDNRCASSPNQVGPDLDLTVDGALSVSGSFVSSGTIFLRNSPELTPALVRAAAAGGPAAAAALVTASVDPCEFDGAAFGPPPGAPLPAAEGEDGADGVGVVVACSGDAAFLAGEAAAGPGGGGGAAPAGDDGDPDVPAGQGERGGDGGDGGDITFVTPMGIEYVSWTYRLDAGAPGEPHTVVAPASGQSAEAEAGSGGDGGGLTVSAGGGIVIGPEGLRIVAGPGGAGGDASATGGDGDPNQKGGDATATAGHGGHTTEGQLTAQGNVQGESNIELVGAGAGDGGTATATAGRGGGGTEEDKDGAMGGDMTANGGNGGEARTRSLSGATVGDGGDGGDINLAGGRGGDGFDFCPVDPGEIGGMGGMGGGVPVAAAASGPGGTPSPTSRPGTGGDAGPGTSDDGEDGEVNVADETGRGGDGGDGADSGSGISGEGGEGGDPSGLPPGFTPPPGSDAFERGDDGPVCNANPELEPEVATTTPRNTPVTVTIPYSDEDGDLAQVPGIVNNLDASEGSIDSGSWMRDATSVSFLFIPATDFVGTALFQVAVLDERDALSNNAFVSVDVVNQSPVYNADAEEPGSPVEVEVVRGGSAMIDLPFMDPDDDAMSFMYVQDAGPDHGEITPATLPSGTAGPTVTYQHDGGDAESDMFSVEADDGFGGMTTGQVDITILDQPHSIEHEDDYHHSHLFPGGTCPDRMGQAIIRNHTTESSSFYAGSVSEAISFAVDGGQPVPQGVSGTIPAGGSRVIDIFFNCVAPEDVETVLEFHTENSFGSASAEVPASVTITQF